MKKCPYCAEEIQDEAIKCKHCGEMLDENAHNLKNDFKGLTPKILPSGTLHTGEKLYFEIRPYKVFYYLFPAVLAITSFFWPLVWVITIITFLISHAQWKNRIYAITNKRVISLKGIVIKVSKECPIGKIQNVEVKSYWGSNNVGDILFDTAGGPFKELRWENIDKPRDIYNKISEIIHK